MIGGLSQATYEKVFRKLSSLIQVGRVWAFFSAPTGIPPWFIRTHFQHSAQVSPSLGGLSQLSQVEFIISFFVPYCFVYQLVS